MSGIVRSMSVSRIRVAAIAAVCAVFGATFLGAPTEAQYQKPPVNIEKVLNAPATPTESVSSSGEYVVLYRSMGAPTITDMSEPMLRLAGLRINPLTSAPHTPPASFTAI